MKLKTSHKDKCRNSEAGATMVEYAMMVALIAAVCLIAIRNIGTAGNVAFSEVATQMNTATN